MQDKDDDLEKTIGSLSPLGHLPRQTLDENVERYFQSRAVKKIPQSPAQMPRETEEYVGAPKLQTRTTGNCLLASFSL